jgi:hypothetical protein
MSRFVNRKSILSVLVALTLVIGFVGGMTLRGGTGVHATGAPFASFGDYVKWVASHHKAPFDRDSVAYSALLRQQRAGVRIILLLHLRAPAPT